MSDKIKSYAEGDLVQGDTVNVVSPEGDLQSIYKSDLPKAQDAGYRPSTPEDEKQYLIQSQYGQGLEPLKTSAEAAARSATFGLSTKAEKMFGVKPEAISGREQANPYAAGLGDVAGLLGSTFYGGEGAVLAKLGAKAVPKALQGAGLASKIGSAAVKGAVETAGYQAGNEAHKMFIGAPGQTIGTAATEIGMSGLLGLGVGGAFGTLHPLWQQTTGNKLEGFLGALQRRANGESVSLAPELEKAIGTSGMDIAPEINTALSDDPELRNLWQKLQESTTSPGIKAQEALKEFKEQASENIVNSFGKTADEIPNISDISNFESGSKLQDKLAKEIESRFEPVSKEFNSMRDQFSKISLTAESDVVADKLAQLGQNERWNVPSLPQNKLLQETITDLPHLKDLEDLRRYQSNIWGKVSPLDGAQWNAAGKIVNVLRQVENDTLEKAAGAQSPELLSRLKSARSSYGQMADMLEDMNSRLHVGKYSGPETFIKALRDMKPEDVLNRLSKPNDAGLMEILGKQFPELSNDIRETMTNKLLANAAKNAPEGHAINSKTLFNALDKMTPELKSYLLPPGAGNRINATRAILDKLPERMNPSGTAKTLDALWNKVPGSATALGSVLMGHNPITGFLFGQVGKWLGRDVPDAIRLGFLKFLGQSGPINPQAFKKIVDLAASAMKGESATNKAIKNIFRSGRIEIAQAQMPDDNSVKKLDRKLKEFAINPIPMQKLTEDLSYYSPEHAQAASQVTSNAVNYLNSLRPKTDKPGILDEEREPTSIESQRYNDALRIADKPLSITNHISNGSLVPEDVITLRTLYPGLYDRMSQKINEQIMESQNNGDSIPYKTRIGLSLFLGQPLDFSMQPQSILMNQPAPPQQPQQQGPKRGTVAGTKNLGKLVTSIQTPDQARMSHKLEKG